MSVNHESEKIFCGSTTNKLERGQTPENIEQICFDLCRDYLGDIWLNLTIDEVEVRRLSGGLTNQLYYCGIKGDKQLSNGKGVQHVAIKLYQRKHFLRRGQTNDRLDDHIIASMVSQNGLGSKVYGIFEGGMIQQFYKVNFSVIFH